VVDAYLTIGSGSTIDEDAPAQRPLGRQEREHGVRGDSFIRLGGDISDPECRRARGLPLPGAP